LFGFGSRKNASSRENTCAWAVPAGNR